MQDGESTRVWLALLLDLAEVFLVETVLDDGDLLGADLGTPPHEVLLQPLRGDRDPGGGPEDVAFEKALEAIAEASRPRPGPVPVLHPRVSEIGHPGTPER